MFSPFRPHDDQRSSPTGLYFLTPLKSLDTNDYATTKSYIKIIEFEDDTPEMGPNSNYNEFTYRREVGLSKWHWWPDCTTMVWP